MPTSSKRICSDDGLKENVGEQSSYAKMKCKMKTYSDELVQLRVDLKEAQTQKEDIEAAVEIGRIEQHRNKRGSSRDVQSSYAKLKMESETNYSKLALVQILLHNAEEELVKVRMELQEEKRKHDEDCREWRRELQEEKRKHAEDCREWRMELQEEKRKLEVECSQLRTDLQEEKRKHEVDFRELCADLQQVNSKNENRIKVMTEEIKGLRRSMELRLLHMESLKETIRKGTTAYDAMVARVENIDRTTEQQRTVQSLRTNKAVCRAFGWSLENADPHLLRAACGFWESTTMVGFGNLPRWTRRSTRRITRGSVSRCGRTFGMS
jgi:hypothetical protein